MKASFGRCRYPQIGVLSPVTGLANFLSSAHGGAYPTKKSNPKKVTPTIQNQKMMKTTTCKILGIALVGAAFFTAATDGAQTTNWQSVTAATNSSDVITSGSLVLATLAGSSDETVNGVTFQKNTSLLQNGVTFSAIATDSGNNWNGWGGWNGFVNGVTLGGADGAAYTAMVGTEFYGNGNGSGNPDAPIALTLSGLQVGHSYLTQFWVADTRNSGQPNGGPLSITITTSGGLDYGTPTLDFGYGINYVIGTFTAVSDSLTFDITGNSVNINGGTYAMSQIGAFQLRDVTVIPEPSAWAMLLGGAGMLTIRRRRA
jgi:hypothetical protein